MATIWAAPLVTDMDDVCVAAQMTAIRTAALNTSPVQTDPFTRVMTMVTARMRIAIGTHTTNQVSLTANSVPPEYKWVALYLILAMMQVRLPLALSKDQLTQIERAEETLALIASGDLAVSLPSDPTTSDAQTGGNSQVVSYTARGVTAASMAGL